MLPGANEFSYMELKLTTTDLSEWMNNYISYIYVVIIVIHVPKAPLE